MNMESKEKWINKVIDSGTSLETKTHQPFLYRKTINKMEQGVATTRSWLAKPILASLFFLIFANSITVYNYSSVEENETSSYTEEVVSTTSEDITTILDEYALQDAEASLYNF